jgi:hypothetical protein
MKRVASALLVLLMLAPVSAWAEPARPEMGSPPPGHTQRPHPRPPFVHRPFPFISCCLGVDYVPLPPPVIVPAQPPIVYVIPSAPSLVYVAPPRPEPAPEIVLPTGRWERHGNGVEYPYTWVWQPAYSR